MPGDPLLPESTSARLQSPDTADGRERKRRRKVLSCYDCRRRKLQCDRAMPSCTRCVKAGYGANCLYIDEATDALSRNPDSSAHRNPDLGPGMIESSSYRPTQTGSTSGDALSRLEYQDRRIRELEAALVQTNHIHPSGPLQQMKSFGLPLTPESIKGVNNAAGSVNATDRDTMLIRGKSFKTQFHGITHPGSLIAYIPELAIFTRETFKKFPGLARIRQDLHALKDRTEYASQKYQPTTDADLRAMLPSRAETDQLVQLYLDNYDCIYHIIHRPSFREEYDQTWSDLASARPHFIAIVLLMIACAQCLMTTEPWLYTANSSIAREKALAITRRCEDWLGTQSQKHVTAADFQIRFLILLAKLLNASKFKRTWTEAGTVLRFCMGAGLHRNPDLLRKPTSVVDKELRRRIWYAVAEFELEASFARGMISASWLQQSDCNTLNNIHDDDIDHTSEHLPNPKPISEFTSSSYLVMANDTFMLRYTLNTVLNNIRHNISFDEAKGYTEELETHLQAIPEWIGKTAEVPKVLLAVTLRQYLLVLHDRQIRQATSPSERNLSKMVLIENASKILEMQKILVDKGYRALQFLCHDQIVCALSACHVVTMSDPRADSLLTQLVNQGATRVMDNAIELITDKITRLGREQRQLWIVLSANAFMKTKRDPSQAMVYMQEAVDKVTRPYFKIMACQESAPTAVSSAPPTGRADLPDGIIEFFPDQKYSEFATDDTTLLDLDAVSAQWTFDDWTFNPGEFQNFGDLFPPQM